MSGPPPAPICPRHPGKQVNMVFADMHVESDAVIWTHSACDPSYPKANLLYDLSSRQSAFYGLPQFKYYLRPNTE